MAKHHRRYFDSPEEPDQTPASAPDTDPARTSREGGARTDRGRKGTAAGFERGRRMIEVRADAIAAVQSRLGMA